MKKIVIAGLGYAGISFLRALKNKENFDITLVDQNPFHYLQPEVYSYIANKSLLSDIVIDLIPFSLGLSEKIKFIKDKVINVDFNKNILITNEFEIPYDYLIISLGSRTFFPPIEGLRENSSGVKTIDRSMKFKHYFEKKVLERLKKEGVCAIDPYKEFNIIIGGGGLSGVEIASEMAHFQTLFNRCPNQTVNIIIIEALDTILYGMDEFIIENSIKRLKELGVDIITGKKITNVEKNKVYLENGSSLHSDFLIWTGGIVASSVMENLNIKLNRKKQAIVDEYFRIEGIDNVFAIGDCAQTVDLDTGDILPPTAQISIQAGKIVANHINDIESNKPLQKKSPKLKGILVALGGKYSVGKVGNFYIKGYPAYILKRFILNKYKLPLVHISREGFDKINNSKFH